MRVWGYISEGIIVYALNVITYITCTICQQTSCHGNTWDDNVTLDMHTRIRPADWCAARTLLSGEKASLAGWQLAGALTKDGRIHGC